MRRVFVCFLLACVMTVSAAAAFVPDSEVCENRDGRQLIIKTYTLSPGDDPDTLIEDAFEREGYSYSFLNMVKEENPFESRKTHSETVTVETDSQDLSVILAALDATLPYDDGEYSGALTLDHTSLHTEATGYSTKSYTVSDTKTYEGLDRNDPSYIPKTTVKNGVTLTLQSIEWSVQSTALADDALIPSQYMAVAAYSAGASYKAANGYVTTASYTGEIVSSGIESIVYTVTYVGEPILEPEPEPEKTPIVRYLIYAGFILLVIAGAAAVYIFARKNTKVYAMDQNGEEYELIGRQWISPRSMTIDLLSFKRYPEDAAVIEVESKTARRLFGRLVRIRLRGGTTAHRIEQNGNDSYWFKVSTITQEEIAE